jgi:hypothetical protein
MANLGLPQPTAFAKRQFQDQFFQESDWVLVAAEKLKKELQENAEPKVELALAQPKVKAAPAVASSASSSGELETPKKPSKQMGKRARRRAEKLEQEEVIRLKVARLTATLSSSSICQSTIEGVTQGLNEIKLICEEGAPMETRGGSSVVSTMVPATGDGLSDVTTLVLATDTLPGPSAGRAVAGGGISSVGGSSSICGGEESSGPDEQDATTRSFNGKLSCCECGTYVPKRSEFLLHPGGPSGCDASWQGHMWGHCQVCSEMPLKKFQKLAKRSWFDRANALRERVQHVRCADFNNVAAIIAKQLPGASRKTMRYLATSRIACATAAFAVAFSKENAELLEARDMITRQHFADIEAAAANPRNACSVDPRFLIAQEAQYLTSLALGITISFCCRNRKCLWFGLNHEWPKASASEHFRCPCCAQLYQPTASGKDRAPFSFVLSMPDLETGQQVHVPACWPNSEDHKWLLGQIEAYAIAPSTQVELQAYNLRTAQVQLHELLERVKIPAHFEEVPWNPNAVFHMPSNFDLSLYRKRMTTFGCKLDRVRDQEAIEHPFTDWPLLIAMVGRVVAQTRSGGDAVAMARAMFI